MNRLSLRVTTFQSVFSTPVTCHGLQLSLSVLMRVLLQVFHGVVLFEVVCPYICIYFFFIELDYILSDDSVNFTEVVDKVCVTLTALVDGLTEDNEVVLIFLINEDDPAVEIDEATFIKVTILDIPGDIS